VEKRAGKGADVFATPPTVRTEIFARLPDALRMHDKESAWTLARGSGPLHSFLEGPAFDRDGNLYCVDLAHGRIFRISPQGDWQVFAEYDGKPNGLKIHRDGRIFVADGQHGILAFDPRSGQRSTVLDRFQGRPLAGPNDLVFADNGDLYFTDPGRASLGDPTGRVLRIRADGTPELLMQNLPYPNGLVLTPAQNELYVAVTYSLQVVRLPLHADATGVYRWRGFLQLSGGLAGPDGMAVDEAGNLVVVHAGFGTVWQFDPLGEPIARIRSCAGIRTTNVAYGGPDRRTLFITEAEHGVILTARMPVPGRPMYSHR
jgi:gluconolactonase